MIKECVEYIESHSKEIGQRIENLLINHKNDIKNYYLSLLHEEVKDNSSIKYDFQVINEMSSYIEEGETHNSNYSDYATLKYVNNNVYIKIYEDDIGVYEYEYVSPNITIDEYVKMHNVRPSNCCDCYGLDVYTQNLSCYINTLIEQDIKEYLENIFKIQISDKDFDEIKEYTDYFECAYSECSIPPSFDENYIIDFVDIRNITIKEVINYGSVVEKC